MHDGKQEVEVSAITQSSSQMRSLDLTLSLPALYSSILWLCFFLSPPSCSAFCSLIFSTNSILCYRSNRLFIVSPSCASIISNPPSLTRGVQNPVNKACPSTQRLPAGPSPMCWFNSSCPVTHKFTRTHTNTQGKKEIWKKGNSLRILSQTQTNQMCLCSWN